MSSAYILIWRRSETSRQLDVQVDNDKKIMLFDHPPSDSRIVDDEESLIAYVNSSDIYTIAVPESLAHSVLGWSTR